MIFDAKITEAAKKMNKTYIKADEFQGDGLVLQITGTEKIKSQYGASAENSLVEREILEEGETFRYSFKDAEGTVRKHDSTSMPLFISMSQLEINFGDWIHIKREGKGDKTRYSIEAVDAPVSQRNSESEIDPSQIPF